MCRYVYVYWNYFVRSRMYNQGSLWMSYIKSLSTIHVLKLRTDPLSRSILEVLRKISIMSIVCNAIRLFGRCAQNLIGTVLVLHFCKYYTLLPKKNCCNDSTTTIVDAPILCLCQIPLWFV